MQKFTKKSYFMNLWGNKEYVCSKCNLKKKEKHRQYPDKKMQIYVNNLWLL